MLSSIDMDQRQEYIISAGTTSNTTAMATEESDIANDLPSDINQMDFQTIKAASDTLKVSIQYFV